MPHLDFWPSPHLALWSQPTCATHATPGPSVFTPHLAMWSATLCHPSGPFPSFSFVVTTTPCHSPVFAPPVALGSPTCCATQYGSFMPLVLLTQSLLHHPAFVPLGLYATLSAFEPHLSSDLKPNHPRFFATCRLRSPYTLETWRLLFCLHWTNPSHARLKASG